MQHSYPAAPQLLCLGRPTPVSFAGRLLLALLLALPGLARA